MPEQIRQPEPSRSAPTSATLGFAALVDPELSARDRLVFWALAYWAWGKKSECWPSNEQIGTLIGYKPRSVQLAMAQLARRGHVYRKMVRTATGWHRVLIIAERWTPELKVVEPAGGGGATACATGRASPGHRVVQAVAPPLAQAVAHQEVLDSEGVDKELATASGPKRGPAAASPEPEWLKVDNLSPGDVLHWRDMATVAGPFNRIARKIVERWEKLEGLQSGNGPAPASPAKNTRGPAVEGFHPTDPKSIKERTSGQDNLDSTEHNDH